MRHLKEIPVYDVLDTTLHPEHETRNTRVSEYLRKYGQGKIDDLPRDSRPEVHDNRSVDEMLDDPSHAADHMSFDELDAISEMNRKADDFKKAFADVKLTVQQKQKFDAAVKVLQDKNASDEQRLHALSILDELEQKHLVTRARV